MNSITRVERMILEFLDEVELAHRTYIRREIDNTIEVKYRYSSLDPQLDALVQRNLIEIPKDCTDEYSLTTAGHSFIQSDSALPQTPTQTK